MAFISDTSVFNKPQDMYGSEGSCHLCLKLKKKNIIFPGIQNNM